MAEAAAQHVRESVVFHDPVGTPHPALVTAVWSATCINVVFVSSDEAKTDPYGRQIERATSLSHKSVNSAHGMYWRFEDEEPNPVATPLEK
jgi:hypothetical protein